MIFNALRGAIVTDFLALNDERIRGDEMVMGKKGREREREDKMVGDEKLKGE